MKTLGLFHLYLFIISLSELIVIYFRNYVTCNLIFSAAILPVHLQRSALCQVPELNFNLHLQFLMSSYSL